MLVVLYLVFGKKLNLNLDKNLDFLYTFIFFTFSYLFGEIIQTIAHELEWIIFSFFKFYKPSEIFLYKDNPVLKNENIRSKLFKHLDLSLDTDYIEGYKTLPIVWWKREKQQRSQSFFWQLYTNVSDSDELKTFNRSYVQIRAILIVFCSSAIIFYLTDKNELAHTCIILWLICLWRARGMARNLVFKTVMLNLKKGR